MAGEVDMYLCAWKPRVSPRCPQVVQAPFDSQLTLASLSTNCGKCPSKSPLDPWGGYSLYHVTGFLIVALDLSVSLCSSVKIHFPETFFTYCKSHPLKCIIQWFIVNLQGSRTIIIILFQNIFVTP